MSEQVAISEAATANLVITQHYVTFYSPGTFVHETSSEKVESWDVAAATDRAREIVERYGARPFAFEFSTVGRTATELNSKKIAGSPRYYLGGRIETLEEVEARNDPKEEILRSNMRCNGWNRIIVNDNSWRTVQPLEDSDVVLPFNIHAAARA